jgi:CO/xanthine dehydrogenase FAD-binding subunit
LFIGAAVPLRQIVQSPLVAANAQALVEACELIGGPQVRNTATLGGNVCHALPAADGTIALLALEADAEVADRSGSRRLPLQDLFQGPGQSTLDPRAELLLGFYLKLKEAAQGSAHRRVMRPQGVAIAILNMAIWVLREANRIQDIRVAVGPAGPTPFRAHKTEEFLRGAVFSAELFAGAQQALLSEAKFRTSPHRSTAEYRRHLSGVLLQETLSTAWQRTF